MQSDEIIFYIMLHVSDNTLRKMIINKNTYNIFHNTYLWQEKNKMIICWDPLSIYKEEYTSYHLQENKEYGVSYVVYQCIKNIKNKTMSFNHPQSAYNMLQKNVYYLNTDIQHNSDLTLHVKGLNFIEAQQLLNLNGVVCFIIHAHPDLCNQLFTSAKYVCDNYISATTLEQPIPFSDKHRVKYRVSYALAMVAYHPIEKYYTFRISCDKAYKWIEKEFKLSETYIRLAYINGLMEFAMYGVIQQKELDEYF